MPPTRGHDLKHIQARLFGGLGQDAPTRGHDLKLFGYHLQGITWVMPPHGGTT